MRRTVSMAFVMVLAAGAAHAEMVSDYAGWRKLTAGEQAAYAAGFIDGHLVGDGGPASVAYTLGARACFAKLGVTAKSLAGTINDYYRQNSKAQSSPPGVAVLRTVMRGPCLPFINAERKKYKLEPLTKSDG